MTQVLRTIIVGGTLLGSIGHACAGYHPQRAVNFTRETNACYIAAMLQVLIAVPAWREYIMSYPPESCRGMVYDKEILKALQDLITGYTRAAEPDSGVDLYRIEDFYKVLKDKQVVKHCGFDRPKQFLDNLDDSFRKLNRLNKCGLDKLMEFRYKETKTTRGMTGTTVVKETEKLTDYSIRIALPLPSRESLLARIQAQGGWSRQSKMNEKKEVVEYKRALSSAPRLLCIEFDREEFPRGQISFFEIAEVIDIADLMDPKPAFSIYYQCRSIIWASHNHFIAYVRYGDIWYVCNDLKHSPSFAVTDVGKEFETGIITKKYDYPIFYPVLLLYEKLQQEQPVEVVPELHASLAFLGM